MNIIKDHPVDQYWCAYSEDKIVFHTGFTPVGGQLKTGQPHLERFNTEAELEARVNELMGEDYYRSQQEGGE